MLSVISQLVPKHITKEKETVNICDMDTRHIVNTIHMLARKDESVARMLKTLALIDELKERVRDCDAAEEQRIHEECMNSISDHWGSD